MNYSYKRYWEPSLGESVIQGVAIGGIGTAVVYPLDFVKTRLQQRFEAIGIRQKNQFYGTNMNKIWREVHQQGRGLSALYEGLGAAVIARTGYLFVRNFLYKVIYDRFKPVKPTNDLTWREKALIGAVAGGVAAYVTNPFEVINTRQICDGAFKPELRRNYGSALAAYGKILKQEGGLGLFKGVIPNVLKAVAMNMILTGTYDWANERLYISLGDWSTNRPFALAYAALFASLATLPLDNIKTRLQLAWPDESRNRLNYKGTLDCFRKACNVEGMDGLWVGFLPYYLRTIAYGVATIYILDVFNNRAKRAAGLRPEQI